jgi:hypothetical protein
MTIETKLCPFLMISAAIISNECQLSKCAWYLNEQAKCAIWVIAKNTIVEE